MGDVPTHRDYPWERDARAHPRADSPPGPAGRTTRWWAWAALVLIGVLVLALKLAPLPRTQGTAVVGQGSRTAAAPITQFVVRGLRSEFVSERRLRVWGSATAPQGAKVRVRVRIAGAQLDIPRPIRVDADGLFEGIIKVPAPDHRGARVQAVLVP